MAPNIMDMSRDGKKPKLSGCRVVILSGWNFSGVEWHGRFGMWRKSVQEQSGITVSWEENVSRLILGKVPELAGHPLGLFFFST